MISFYSKSSQSKREKTKDLRTRSDGSEKCDGDDISSNGLQLQRDAAHPFTPIVQVVVAVVVIVAVALVVVIIVVGCCCTVVVLVLL